MVLVDGSPAAIRAIRRAAALAGSLHAAFMALVVETPQHAGQPFDRARDLKEALDDAVDLGADVVRVEARDLVSGLEEVARTWHATHLVLPHRESPGGLGRLRERPLVDRLVERLPDVELHVVAAGTQRRG